VGELDKTAIQPYHARKPEPIFDYRFEDFEIVNYQAHPHIPAPVAV